LYVIVLAPVRGKAGHYGCMNSAPVSEHRLHRRVQFHETDAAGMVHFSWFYRYMEEAEHALWRAAGLSVAEVQDVFFPRVSASFDFKNPLRFGDEFEVVIRVAGFSEKTIRYACAVVRGETPIASGTLVAACVSVRPGQPLKAVPIPQAIRDRFAVAPMSGE
jgi:YbgC/YbaW family acyl-CoA thioester hydrolase